jgi:hypothetical protein
MLHYGPGLTVGKLTGALSEGESLDGEHKLKTEAVGDLAD